LNIARNAVLKEENQDKAEKSEFPQHLRKSKYDHLKPENKPTKYRVKKKQVQQAHCQSKCISREAFRDKSFDTASIGSSGLLDC